MKTASFCTCGSNNWETIEDRWVHAVRGLASTELSFHLCNILRDCRRGVPRANKKMKAGVRKNDDLYRTMHMHKLGICQHAVSICLSVRLSRS